MANPSNLPLVSNIRPPLRQNRRWWTNSTVQARTLGGSRFQQTPNSAVRKSEEHLSQLLDTARILVWEADPETWLFTYVSQQAMSLVGYPVEKWYEPDFFASHIHPLDRERVFSLCGPGHDRHLNFEFRMVARDGRVIWLQNLVNISDRNVKHPQMHGFMIDITEKKLAEEVLQDIGGRLIAAQEEERSRVARELHDDVNQRMALLSIELEQIRKSLQKRPEIIQRFDNLRSQVDEICTDIHRLCYSLHPSKLDHLGLAAAVKSLCSELSEKRNLRIALQEKGVPTTLPKDVTLCVFRIAQEALRNCVKHSGACDIKVVLEKKREAIRLLVSDNGCGFDPQSETIKKGLGFISMRERLHFVGGDIQIYSKPLHGTRIEVSVPITREPESNEIPQTGVRPSLPALRVVHKTA